MKQNRQTAFCSRLFLGILAVIWIMIFVLVAVVVYILLPSVEHGIIESYTITEAHRPLEARRYLRYQTKMEDCQAYLNTLENEEYEAVFLSMYSLESFSEEDFRDYRGLSVLKIETILENSLELMGALDLFLSCETPPERIYLGIDPIKLERHLVWEENIDWQETMEALVRKHEDTLWEVLLAYPSYAEWQLMPDAERKEGIASYGRAMDAMVSLENLSIFYVGGQQWLICNQDNYVEKGVLTPSVTHTITLRVFCDQDHMVTRDNREEMLEELENTLDTWQHDLPDMGELTGYTLVFLGDSIFGNYTDSTSIPGVVQRFSGAKCINCGYGGICLSAGGWVEMSGVDVITNLCSGDVGDIPKETAAYKGIQEFSLEEQGKERLLFFLNYGINDYLQGQLVENEDKYETASYAGAMRRGIERLQAAYPEAEIVVLTPSYITYGEKGSLTTGEIGGILKTYADAAVKVAQEYSLPYMNIYEKLEQCAEKENLLSADGIHLNESGRFRLGIWICEKLNDEI